MKMNVCGGTGLKGNEEIFDWEHRKQKYHTRNGWSPIFLRYDFVPFFYLFTGAFADIYFDRVITTMTSCFHRR